MKNAEVWTDIKGNVIQAHGGAVIWDKGRYYWFGENKNGPTYKRPGEYERVDVIGISCYSSENFVDWVNEGIALEADTCDLNSDIHISKVVERPKVVYCEKSKKYVMWVHVDESNYSKAAAGVALSDKITGPYEYIRSIKPNGIDSRDMTVFKDSDGKGYLIHSGDWNKTMYISQLNDEYTDTTGEYIRIFEDESREAPAIFKRNNKYYLITSGCTGWEPNEAMYAVAEKMMGEWTAIGNPCIGKDAELTFRAQSTYVLERDTDSYILMLDIWKPENLSDSRYVWLPIVFDGDNIQIAWCSEAIAKRE